jgi:DNA-directed RNA polymerase III subunit RPC11
MQITKRAVLNKKEVDDVLGGEDAWKNVAKTDGG